MPLKKRTSRKVISSNTEELLHKFEETGTIGTSRLEYIEKAQKQAVAIACSEALKK